MIRKLLLIWNEFWFHYHRDLYHKHTDLKAVLYHQVKYLRHENTIYNLKKY